MFEFEITSNCSNTAARTGIFHTPNGQVNTPKFMPVGTLATVKGISSKQLTSTGSEMILSNTFHLHLQPGEKLVKESGGIHKFMNWTKPILTDSGGYQVFSLAKLNNISDKGVEFKNPRDGSHVFLSPEKVIQIQMDLGSDVAMAFDHCPPHTANENDIEDSLQRTHSWLQKCVETHQKSNQALFGIVQGGVYNDLRLESLEGLQRIDFDGYALGGLAVGESQNQMFKVLDYIVPHMPKNKPRYLMGVGTPSDILGAVKRGIDMFDCVIPTRSGRTGLAFTWEGKINLRNSKYKNDDSPIDRNANIRNLNAYSKSYINHLINSNEILASMLLTLNNIFFYQQLMQKIRESIKTNTFDKFYNKYIKSISNS